MAQHVATWNGTDHDLYRLQTAVAHNCNCEPPSENNPRPPLCPAHRMLSDQTALNHFAFAGKQRRRYLRKEFSAASEWF